jgi:hypothetical protein
LSCAHVGICAKAAAEVIAITVTKPNERTNNRFMGFLPAGDAMGLKKFDGIIA